MVESPSFESTPQQKTSEMKTGNFPVLENRLIDMPDATQSFSEIQSSLNSLRVSSERTRIERNLFSADDDMLDADIILLLKQAKEDISKIQMVEEKIRKTEVDTQKTEAVTQVKVEETQVKVEETQVKVEETQVKVEETQKAEVTTDALKTREHLNVATKRMQKLYVSFGSQEKFKELNPDFDKWTGDAAKRIDPGSRLENNPDLLVKAQLLAIQEHRAEIDQAAKAGLSGDQLAKYNSNTTVLFRDIESSLVDLKVTYTPASLPKSAPLIDLLDYKKGDVVTRTWNELKFGDQVIDISTRPPTRSIESGGLRVTFDKTEKKEQNYRDQEAYRESRGELTREIAALGKEIGDKREGMQEKYRLLGQMKEDYKGGPEGSEEQKGLKVLIEKTEKELEDFKQKTERLTLLQATLKALDAAEALRANTYQDSLKSETESSRENLKYLESTHLAWLLGDSGMKLFIAQINDHKDSYIQGSSELRLQTLWGPVEKNLFALGLKKLLWLDPKEMNVFFEPNGFDLRKFTDPPMKDMIKGKLKESGTYGGQPPALSREKLINVMNGAKKE